MCLEVARKVPKHLPSLKGWYLVTKTFVSSGKPGYIYAPLYEWGGYMGRVYQDNTSGRGIAHADKHGRYRLGFHGYHRMMPDNDSFVLFWHPHAVDSRQMVARTMYIPTLTEAVDLRDYVTQFRKPYPGSRGRAISYVCMPPQFLANKAEGLRKSLPKLTRMKALR